MKKLKIVIGIILCSLVIISFIGFNIYVDNKLNNDFIYKKSNDIVKELESPSKDNVAIAYISDGGATTSWAPGVAIRHDSGFYRKKTEVVFSGYRDKYIDIEWKDENTLNVYYKCPEEEVRNKVKELNGIKIIYTKVT